MANQDYQNDEVIISFFVNYSVISDGEPVIIFPCAQIGGIEKLSKVLEGFNAKAILYKYAEHCEAILDDIVKRLNPKGKVRRTLRGIWPHYCKTILSAANFIEQFSSASGFFDWADFIDKDERACASLPMLLSREAEGLVFALSCDFLNPKFFITPVF